MQFCDATGYKNKSKIHSFQAYNFILRRNALTTFSAG